MVSPAGEVKYLEQGRSCFLGVDPAIPRSSMGQAAFAPGSTLLLFTDGLIERRRESLDVGLDRLAQVVAEHWNLPLRRLEQMVFASLVGDGAEDDVALIAVRSVGVSRHLFCDAFTASRDEQQSARNRLRDWLVGAGIPSDHRDVITLAVGEAVSNAIEHGSSNDPTHVVTVELAARGELLTASVGDHGHWVPGLEGVLAGRGRGHLIMQTLCDDIDIDVDNGGTVVTLQFSRQPAQQP
jgi:anti-sigma regulatory factor (Ser/Thr protein kinase)